MFSEEQYKDFLKMLDTAGQLIQYLEPTKEQFENVYKIQGFWSLGTGGKKIFYDEIRGFYIAYKETTDKNTNFLFKVKETMEKEYNFDDDYGFDIVLNILISYYINTKQVKVEKNRIIMKGDLISIEAILEDTEIIELTIENPYSVYRTYIYKWKKGRTLDNQAIWELTD